jgi:signal transduction histidine kinase
MDLPMSLPAARVDAELRYNLFLALKEALNNVVKHAKATEVWLRLRLAEKTFTLVIEDNGRGLAEGAEASNASADRLSSGSGLENMKKRLAVVGGHCEIHSEPGRGTRIEMTAGIQPLVSPVMAIGQDSQVE